MKVLSKIFLNCSIFALLPVFANAAGTYYTGGYQSPQNRYSQQPYAQRASSYYSQQGVSNYNKNQYANAGYSTANRGNVYQQNKKLQQSKQKNNVVSSSKDGFSFGAGISRQTGMWQFEMKESQSILHYDNIDWNVLDVNAAYVFGGDTKVKIGAGVQYGMQAGESTMIDDDVSNGGYFIAELVDTNGDFYGNLIGRALSAGTSKGGSMMGFNAGVGLQDFMKVGNLKITPSVGWRYLKYSLETSDNHVMSMESTDGGYNCYMVEGSDEMMCEPILGWYDGAFNSSGEFEITGESFLVPDVNGLISTPAGYINTGRNFYATQAGVTHKYDVEWSGPYLAFDILYDINQHNNVNAFVELGLPSYTATGDQPYRFDWQHPKSVEDTKGLGGAFHLGLGANWTTALTDSVALSIGMTYDYYTVSDADAKTYLNGDYYNELYNAIFIDGGYATEEDMLANNSDARNIKQMEEECPGWVCNADGEIESFYKSLGVRVGINARF